MVSTQQAQRRGLLPHGLQHHHALPAAQGTVPASLPSLLTLILPPWQEAGAKPWESWRPVEAGLPFLSLGGVKAVAEGHTKGWRGGMQKPSPRRGV